MPLRVSAAMTTKVFVTIWAYLVEEGWQNKPLADGAAYVDRWLGRPHRDNF
jgi:hypothetical protein